MCFKKEYLNYIFRMLLQLIFVFQGSNSKNRAKDGSRPEMDAAGSRMIAGEMMEVKGFELHVGCTLTRMGKGLVIVQ